MTTNQTKGEKVKTDYTMNVKRTLKSNSHEMEVKEGKTVVLAAHQTGGLVALFKRNVVNGEMADICLTRTEALELANWIRFNVK